MSSKRLSDIGESGWLETVAKTLGGVYPDLLTPIGDDAAVWRLEGNRLQILTSDAQVEGTHFQKEWLDWSGLARRALLAAASDVSAMGGVPTGFLLSLGVPPDTLASDLEAFANSLAELVDLHGFVPLGGDTVRSEKIFVDVTFLGAVAEEDLLLQTGAQPVDALWVTGSLGNTRAAWTALDDPREGEEDIRERFWNPPARWEPLSEVRAGLKLRAMTDLSDGLARDLDKVLRKSNLGAEIDLDQLPLSGDIADFAKRRGHDPAEFAYLGGEDFELLLVEAGAQRVDGTSISVPLTRIGRIVDNGGRVQLFREGREVEIAETPFDHFGPAQE